jgi:hypothetical protein
MSGKIRNPERKCKMCGAKCEKQMRYCVACAIQRKAARVGVYFTPKAALDVIREQPADIVLANPPLEFATGSGGYLCEIAREMEGITPERMTV